MKDKGMLEPYAVKVASTVLRGVRCRNTSVLPDNKNNKVIKSLKAKKKYRQTVNRKKITLGFIMCVMLILIFGTIAFAQSPRKGHVLKADNFEKVEVTIYQNKLPWDIQKELTPNEDINEMLYLVKEINNNNLSNVKIGDTIFFLKEKVN